MNFLKSLFSCIVFFAAYSIGFGQSQSWKPAMEGIGSFQYGNGSSRIHLDFKANGPLGENWVYGTYLDNDSTRRVVAYRKGGRWISLPFSVSYGSYADDIIMYGDTLYIGGNFNDVVRDSDSTLLGSTSLIKYFQDSIWLNPLTIIGPRSMAVRGDSLLISGSSYYVPPTIIYSYFMSSDKGSNWQYPYSVIHPTDTTPDFGAKNQVEILDNGHIITINNNCPKGSPYCGIVRWDGSQWHSYGNGLTGSSSRTFCFDFYKGDLYMGGTFNKTTFPSDPGKYIARWDGNMWQEVGGGLVGFVRDMFVYDSVLYVSISGGKDYDHRFGDAAIPYFAGWDGKQWCGTANTYTRPADSYGVINDTLYASFMSPSKVDGDSVGYLGFFDGDYLHGPNAICSTPGLGEEESNLRKAEIEVFPNPASDFLNIALPQEIENASYELLSLDGKLVQSGVLGKGENTLKISQKLSGVFLLKAQTQNGVVVQKVFFEN